MNCPKCHAPMKDGETYCVKCGFNNVQAQIEIIQKNLDNPNGSTTSNENPFAPTVSPSIDFLDCYIDDNVEEIRNKGFSFCTFFFGIYYYFYRKMYVQGILISIVFSFCKKMLSIIIPLGFVVNIITILIWISICSLTKSIYISHARHRIAVLRSKYPTLTDEQFANLLRRKGGTSLLSALLLVFTSILIFLIYLFTAVGIIFKTVNTTQNKYANDTAYSVINDIRLGITEKMIEEENVPSHTKLPILNYVSYKHGIQGGTFIVDDTGMVEIFDLSLDVSGSTYLCNGTREQLTCKKK